MQNDEDSIADNIKKKCISKHPYSHRRVKIYRDVVIMLDIESKLKTQQRFEGDGGNTIEVIDRSFFNFFVSIIPPPFVLSSNILED